MTISIAWETVAKVGLDKGTVIDDDYVVTGTMLVGGRHVIYPARNRVEDTVAVKFFSEPRLFTLELSLLKRIKSRNVISVLDYCEGDMDDQHGEPNHPPCISLEYAQCDLDTYLKSNFPLPLEAGKVMFIDIAQGLRACHDAGIVHGDVKPQNIMLFHSTAILAGTWKIIDFDAASCIGDKVLSATIHFCAPEVMKSALADITILAHPAQDVYSLGIVLRRMQLQTNYPPTPSPSPESTIGSAIQLEDDIHHPPTRHTIIRMTQMEPTERISLPDLMDSSYMTSLLDTRSLDLLREDHLRSLSSSSLLLSPGQESNDPNSGPGALIRHPDLRAFWQANQWGYALEVDEFICALEAKFPAPSSPPAHLRPPPVNVQAIKSVLDPGNSSKLTINTINDAFPARSQDEKVIPIHQHMLILSHLPIICHALWHLEWTKRAAHLRSAYQHSMFYRRLLHSYYRRVKDEIRLIKGGVRAPAWKWVTTIIDMALPPSHPLHRTYAAYQSEGEKYRTMCRVYWMIIKFSQPVGPILPDTVHGFMTDFLNLTMQSTDASGTYAGINFIQVDQVEAENTLEACAEGWNYLQQGLMSPSRSKGGPRILGTVWHHHFFSNHWYQPSISTAFFHLAAQPQLVDLALLHPLTSIVDVGITLLFGLGRPCDLHEGYRCLREGLFGEEAGPLATNKGYAPARNRSDKSTMEDPSLLHLVAFCMYFGRGTPESRIAALTLLSKTASPWRSMVHVSVDTGTITHSGMARELITELSSSAHISLLDVLYVYDFLTYKEFPSFLASHITTALLQAVPKSTVLLARILLLELALLLLLPVNRETDRWGTYLASAQRIPYIGAVRALWLQRTGLSRGEDEGVEAMRLSRQALSLGEPKGIAPMALWVSMQSTHEGEGDSGSKTQVLSALSHHWSCAWNQVLYRSMIANEDRGDLPPCSLASFLPLSLDEPEKLSIPTPSGYDVLNTHLGRLSFSPRSMEPANGESPVSHKEGWNTILMRYKVDLARAERTAHHFLERVGGFPRNEDSAARLLHRYECDAHGYAWRRESLYLLAFFHLYTRDPTSDWEKGLAFMAKADAMENRMDLMAFAMSCFLRGIILLEKYPSPSDAQEKEIIHHFHGAVKLSFPLAITHLRLLERKRSGLGREKDPEKDLDHSLPLISHGRASFLLAEGMNQSPSVGTWYTRAADAGYARANAGVARHLLLTAPHHTQGMEIMLRYQRAFWFTPTLAISMDIAHSYRRSRDVPFHWWVKHLVHGAHLGSPSATALVRSIFPPKCPLINDTQHALLLTLYLVKAHEPVLITLLAIPPPPAAEVSSTLAASSIEKGFKEYIRCLPRKHAHAEVDIGYLYAISFIRFLPHYRME